jgi:hypothetical protein
MLQNKLNISNYSKINIEHLNKGIYLLKAETNFETYTTKFINPK